MKTLPPTYYRLLARITKAAERETPAIIRALPRELQERIGGLSVRFEDRPTEKMVEQGVPAEALSTVDREAGQITIFIMNLFDRHGKYPGEYNLEFRKVLVKEFEDWAGADVRFTD